MQDPISIEHFWMLKMLGNLTEKRNLYII